MPALDDISIPLEPTLTYHIFNRGNEGRKIFFKKRNYQYFLDKYASYMKAYWDTHAFCLLPNHFHFAISVKNQQEILDAGHSDFSMVSRSFIKENWPDNSKVDFSSLTYQRLSDPNYLEKHMDKTLHDRLLLQLSIWTVSERFRRFLLGYAKAINKQENRHGSLFQKLFRRKLVQPGFSKSLVAYIHRNPIHHSCSSNILAYPWSSYPRFLNTPPEWLDFHTVMSHFGGKDHFKAYHHQQVEDWQETQALIIEE